MEQPTWLHCDPVCGGGSERDRCCLLGSQLAFSHFPRSPQANWALLVLIPGGWACVRSRTPWVSPRSSPVRLGVSPAAQIPTGVCSQRFEALFPHAGTLGCVVCLTPSCSSCFICMRMWDCPFHQPQSCRESSLPGCPAPPLLPVWVSVSS